MAKKFRISALVATTALSALMLVGCSSSNEPAPANEPVEKVEVVEEVETSVPAEEESTTGGYQAIYDEYSARLTNECPTLSLTECAELSTEGVGKMAAYMYSAKGTDGQMKTYEEWAMKLNEVYMASAQ